MLAMLCFDFFVEGSMFVGELSYFSLFERLKDIKHKQAKFLLGKRKTGKKGRKNKL